MADGKDVVVVVPVWTLAADIPAVDGMPLHRIEEGSSHVRAQ